MITKINNNRIKEIRHSQDTCPICAASSNRQRVVVRTREWSIHACEICTNAWTYPPPRTIDYTSQNFHQAALQKPERPVPRSIDDLPPQWRYSLLLQVHQLMRVLPPNAHVLEIGCGEGLLLEELSRHGLRVVGVEPSLTASETARNKNLEVHTGYFPGVPIEGPFDAVVMSHVLEHVPRPVEILEAIDRILMSGGYVLLVQTNWRGLIPRLIGRYWYAWVPEQHFWHFTPQGLIRLFYPFGWSILSIQYSSLIHLPAVQLVADLASRIPGLGDQFQILARKYPRDQC